jgi:hypothetical protein
VDLFEIFYGNLTTISLHPVQLHFIMVSSNEQKLQFNGSNWQDLNRIVALARFAFLQDDDYDENGPKQCAYLAACYEGPALDWAATLPATRMVHFEHFVTATREAFGIADNNITALLRRDLDQLSWQTDVPVFFAEFDRLTLGLGITSHETRVAMVEQKLPAHLKQLLAQQALSFSNYDTMRERFNIMWALDPTRGKSSLTTPSQRPRCGNCGKKGHRASECRSKAK